MTNDATKSVYDVGADYMELVIQFGISYAIPIHILYYTLLYYQMDLNIKVLYYRIRCHVFNRFAFNSVLCLSQ
jgi:hypothetical protein